VSRRFEAFVKRVGPETMREKRKLDERGKAMTEKEEAIGYYTEDGDIYCVECVNKNSGIMKKIEQAITGEDSEKSLYFCDECKKEIK